MADLDTPRRPLFSLAVATVFGVGYIPFAPGTFGSLVGLAIWMMVPASTIGQGLAIIGLFVAGSLAGNVAERYFGRIDPRHVVIDEVMGMLITLFLIPVTTAGAWLGFLLFRATDVIKPWPANRLELLPGGVGVMADDAMAAIYANLALRLCLWSSGYLIV
jgi:phosphatidylglycerophosphatase A